MSFDLHPQLLQVLDNRTLDRPTKVGMLVSNGTSFVSYAVVYILIHKLGDISFTESTSNVPAIHLHLEIDSRNGKVLV
jgi:hypothetical protein